MSSRRILLAIGTLNWLSGITRLAAQQDSAGRDSATVDDAPKPRPPIPFRWKTAGGNYMDPTSFFSLHGYVDAVYAGKSRDWTAPDPVAPGMPGQVLIPNTPRSSFQYDAALFVGSELDARSRLMIEWHLVSDPGGRGAAGPGGNTIVMTEATASWDLVPQYLTMTGGLFWAPFATVNRDWLGAQNLFTVVPIASTAFPAHFNERGLRLDGAHAFTPSTAVNYVVSIGNGVENFDISGQTSYDRNEGKTTIGRIGFFPGLGRGLEIGGSFATGELRDSTDLAKAPDDPLRYRAQFRALGLDASYGKGPFTTRGYLLQSRESFDGAGRAPTTPGWLTRSGLVLEASYTLKAAALPFGIARVVPKARFDRARVEVINPGGVGKTQLRSTVYSVGLTVAPQDRMTLSVEYHIRREGDRLPLHNDRLVVRLTAEF